MMVCGTVRVVKVPNVRVRKVGDNSDGEQHSNHKMSVEVAIYQVKPQRDLQSQP